MYNNMKKNQYKLYIRVILKIVIVYKYFIIYTDICVLKDVE